MKMRIGLAMLGVGVLLLVVFFSTFNPNATLKEAANEEADSASTTPGSGPVTQDEVQKFLDAYNPIYQELYRFWQARRYRALTHQGGIDAHQVTAAHQALLSFAGNDEHLAALVQMRLLLNLPEPLARQIGFARRLAALRPSTLPANLLDKLDDPGTDPEQLPDLYAARNRAAGVLGFPSYLDLLADDLDQDAATWSRQLRGILQADLPLYDALHHYLATVLAAERHQPTPELIPADWLGSGGPGTVDRALAALAASSSPPRPSRAGNPWAEALAFRSAMALPGLPDSLISLRPVMTPSDFPTARLFSLDLGQRFGVLLAGAPDQALTLKAVGILGTADLYLACDRAQLTPLLRGPSCRAFDRAIAHLYTLAAECALRADQQGAASLDHDQLASGLLREAIRGPILQIPLATGAYLSWLQGMNKEVFPAPVVSEKFWRQAAMQAKLARPTTVAAEFALPRAAFGQDTEPAAPLDDVLGWVLAYQLHRYICRNLLAQDLYHADYRGSIKVADFLQGIMRSGRGQAWDRQLREATGEELDPGAMLEYFRPLADWLTAR